MKKKNLLSLLLSAVLLFSACSTEYTHDPPVTSKLPAETTIESSETVEITCQSSEPIETDLIETTQTTSETSIAPTSEATSTTTTITTTTTTSTKTEPTAPEIKGDVVVHFIDVGQGDSIFIELPNNETMLIDAGEIGQGDLVSTYIFSQGYDTIDHVIATHPHSDHIGGMPEVLDTFNIGSFYMTEAISTSSIFEQTLDRVLDSGANMHYVMAGDVIIDNGELLCEVVAPKAIDNDEMNNNSIVLKLTYGNNKFLFTGDAEKHEEDGIWTNIKCDVLKIGHHGSDSSSTSNFLKKVEPKYAVISCGLGNSYGHPTDEVLERLYDRNINVFRTDQQGTIVFTSDGENITVDKNPSEYSPVVATTTVITTVQEQQEQQGSGITYVLNTNTKKIHYESCSSVSQMKDKNKAYTDDYAGAIAQGYKPCGRCNP